MTEVIYYRDATGYLSVDSEWFNKNRDRILKDATDKDGYGKHLSNLTRVGLITFSEETDARAVKGNPEQVNTHE